MNPEPLDDNSQFGAQFGTSIFAKDFMARDTFKRYFDGQQEMIKFAVSVAIKNNLQPAERDQTFKNAHNINDVDKTGQLMALVKTNYPKEPPAKIVQGLAESGFRYLDEQIGQRGLTLDEFFQ
jgi:hypothetical protein